MVCDYPCQHQLAGYFVVAGDVTDAHDVEGTAQAALQVHICEDVIGSGPLAAAR